MTEFNIEDYLNSLPEDIQEIDVDSKEITYLPDLTRFKNLQTLICSNNQLTELPPLNKNLQKSLLDPLTLHLRKKTKLSPLYLIQLAYLILQAIRLLYLPM